KAPSTRLVLSGATLPSAPMTGQPPNVSPFENNVYPPTGAAGSSKLPLLISDGPVPAAGLHSSPDWPDDLPPLLEQAASETRVASEIPKDRLFDMGAILT